MRRKENDEPDRKAVPTAGGTQLKRSSSWINVSLPDSKLESYVVTGQSPLFAGPEGEPFLLPLCHPSRLIVVVRKRRPTVRDPLALDELNVRNGDRKLIGNFTSRPFGPVALVLKIDQCAEYFFLSGFHFPDHIR